MEVDPNVVKFGVVVFFEPDYATKTIQETGRTPVLSAHEAINVYCETPNPASQVFYFNTPEDHSRENTQLTANINDREWLDELFKCI